jgi:hypothetical protein
MPGACSDAQIDGQFTLCDNEPTYSATGCALFKRDPANATCRQCLFATDDESTYGPLIYTGNRILKINVPGCLALRDGNLAASGCGAQMQALESCAETACFTACPDYDAFGRCTRAAEETVCRSFRVDSACGERATYAACLDYPTFAEYYRAVSKLFCGVANLDGGDAADASGY